MCARVSSENATAVWSDAVLVNVNVGLCETNNLILNDTFVWYYQRAYVSMSAKPSLYDAVHDLFVRVHVRRLFAGRRRPVCRGILRSDASEK